MAREVHRKPDKEKGSLPVTTNESYGIIGRNIGIVPDMTIAFILLDIPKPIIIETPIRVIIRVIGIRRADEPAIKLVKTAIERRRFGIETIEMPLIDQTRPITIGDKHSGNGRIGRQ